MTTRRYPIHMPTDPRKQRRDIEDLVIWAFRDQRVELVAQSLRPRAPGPVMSGLINLMTLGTRVDMPAAGTRTLGATCHEDAAVIYDAVMALTPEAWLQVIKHARTATRPEWYEEGPGRFVQPLDRNGEPKLLWRDPRHRRGYLGVVPPVLEGTHPDIVEEGRAVYRLWHSALEELVDVVNAELVDHVAEGPWVPAEPWNFAAHRIAS